jgi:CRP-like cAMP-binding protein
VTAGRTVLSTGVLIRKLGGFYTVGAELRSDLANLARRRVKLAAGDYLLQAGDRFTGLFIVEDGWMFRVRHMQGGGRQIVSLALPGDFLGFDGLMFERTQFDLTAKTDVILSGLETENFRTMMKRHPGLAEALVWANAHEEALLAERVVSLGRRDATQRLAHVLCEIVARLELIERHKGDVLSLPLTQEDFADVLGISIIHVLRTFKRLAELGAVEYRSRKLVLLDTGKLKRIAGFENEYLYFSQRSDYRPAQGE